MGVTFELYYCKKGCRSCRLWGVDLSYFYLFCVFVLHTVGAGEDTAIAAWWVAVMLTKTTRWRCIRPRSPPHLHAYLWMRQQRPVAAATRAAPAAATTAWACRSRVTRHTALTGAASATNASWSCYEEQSWLNRWRGDDVRTSTVYASSSNNNSGWCWWQNDAR